MICGIKIIGTTAKTFSDVSNIADNNKPKKVEEIVKKDIHKNATKGLFKEMSYEELL
jgi:hypothetical protein